MIGLESMGATGQAVTGVGAVLVEAMVLYVVYGALTTALSEPLKSALGGN
ncbi:DUF7512 family protein [Natrinema limicola]|uniref:Uncharacterized protein n=1 Tax=Natrinema limicola JCM 13563 TaxID=1230457 RepID=M0CJH2_9EURY|nr:hypothetical protein [Natrinema limicola]ELZ22009.1 hypothetical protein C476_06242 [Natrinema limicola JCM 13563]